MHSATSPVLLFLAFGASLSLVSAQNDFYFQADAFGACSYDCEDVTRARVVNCRRVSNDEAVSETFCTNEGDVKPDTTASCGLEFGRTYDFEFDGVSTTGTATATTIFFPAVAGDVDEPIDINSQTGGNYQYNSGGTPSREQSGAITGPRCDHSIDYDSATNSCPTTDGHYWYIESTTPEPTGFWAFDSPVLDTSNFAGTCDVTFFLSGVGGDSDLKTMDVQAVFCDGSPDVELLHIEARATDPITMAASPKAALYGPDANDWEEETFTIDPVATSSKKIRVRWEGRVSASRPNGDWALDDITFSMGCGPPSPSSSVTATVTPSISASPTISITPSGSISVSPSISVSISVSATESISISASISVSPSISDSSSVTPSVTPSPSTSPTPTSSPSSSHSPSSSPSASHSASPSPSPSPSHSASSSSSSSSSSSRTSSPSHTASHSPSYTPSASATTSPTEVSIDFFHPDLRDSKYISGPRFAGFIVGAGILSLCCCCGFFLFAGRRSNAEP